MNALVDTYLIPQQHEAIDSYAVETRGYVITDRRHFAKVDRLNIREYRYEHCIVAYWRDSAGQDIRETFPGWGCSPMAAEMQARREYLEWVDRMNQIEAVS